MAKTQTLSFPIRLPDAMQAEALPLLTEGLIRPAEGTRPAKKDYRAIKEQVRALRTDLEDAEAFMAMTNVVEQACNCYLETGIFPATLASERERLEPRGTTHTCPHCGQPANTPPASILRV